MELLKLQARLGVMGVMRRELLTMLDTSIQRIVPQTMSILWPTIDDVSLQRITTRGILGAQAASSRGPQTETARLKQEVAVVLLGALLYVEQGVIVALGVGVGPHLRIARGSAITATITIASVLQVAIQVAIQTIIPHRLAPARSVRDRRRTGVDRPRAVCVIEGDGAARQGGATVITQVASLSGPTMQEGFANE